MALTVGELVAFLKLNRDQYRAGLKAGETEAKVAGVAIGDGLVRGADGRLRDSRGRFAKAGDDAGAAFGQGIERGIQRVKLTGLAQKLRDVRTYYDSSLGPIKRYATATAGLAVKAGAASVVIGAGVGLAGSLFAVVGTLASLVGIAPAGAAAFLSLKFGAAALKVGLLGVGDALSKKLSKPMEQLSPNARRFVDEFGRVVPMLAAAKNSLQDNLFEGLTRYAKPLAERYLPMLTQRGREFTAAFNAGAQILAKDAMDPRTVSGVSTALAAGAEVARAFVFNLRGMLPVLAQVGAAGSQVFRDAGVAAGSYLVDIREKIQAGLQSGGLKEAMTAGVQAGRDLFGILGNVVGILVRVEQAAKQAFGGNQLTLIRQVTGSIYRFLGTADGMGTLVGIFRTLAPVLGALGQTVGIILPLLLPLVPVIRDLALAFLTGLQPVLPIIAQLLVAVGGALTSVLPAVSSFAVAFGEDLLLALKILAPILPILANALAGLLGPTGVLTAALEALAPILPVLVTGFAQVVAVVAGALVEALRQVGPQLPAVVGSFVDLVVALLPIIPAVTQLVPPLVSLAVAALVPAARAATALAPVLVWVADVLGRLGPVAQLIAGLLVGQLVSGWIVSGAAATAGALTQAAAWLGVQVRAVAAGAMFALTVVRTVAGWVLMGVQATLQAARMAAAWLIAMGPVGWVIAAVVGLVALIILKWDTIKRATSAAWGWITGHLGAVARGIVAIFSGWALAGVIIRHWSVIKAGVSAGVGAVVGLVRSLPGKILAALGNLGSLLWEAGKGIMSGLIGGIASKIGELAGKLKFVTGLIPNLKGPADKDRVLLEPAGRLIMRGLIGGIESQRPALAGVLGDVTRMVPATAGQLAQAAARQGAASLAAVSPASAPVVIEEVRVFLGDTELTDIVRTEVSAAGRATTAGALAGTGRRS